MTVKVHLDEQQIKDACARMAQGAGGFASRQIAGVTLHLDRPPNPTPGDQGAGFYAEVTFK